MKLRTVFLSLSMALVLLTSLVFQATPASAADAWQTVGSVGFSAGGVEYTSLAIYNGTPYVAYSDGANSNKATVMKFNGSSWEVVGSAGFSAGETHSNSLALDASGTPYVAYSDQGNSWKTTVMKFNGSSWVNVGSAGFSAGEVFYTRLALDASGTPYVLYNDGGYSGKATVMKFNGSSWVNVGSAGFSAGEAYQPSLAIYDGTPYAAYTDYGNDAKATVMKFNGSNWVNVGSAGFSAHMVYYISLALDASGTPYVAYEDYINYYKATVMKFNGSSWEVVGSADFSAGRAVSTSLAIDASGTPYVAYTDLGNSSKATVMKFDGSSWVNVGSAGFSAGGVEYTSLALDASGTPYVAYRDFANSNKATVMKYGALGPANDDFDTPVTISSIPYSNAQDTTIATTAVDDPNFQCSSYNTGVNSVWYTFTPSQSGTLTARTEFSNFDTMLELWTGTRGSLTSVACNDDYTGIMYSRVDVHVQAGVQYFIEVAGYKAATPDPAQKTSGQIEASSGTLVLSVALVPDPTVQTLTVLSVGTYDGHILESGENTTAGGTLDSTSPTFNLGDDAGDKQYRAILSFNTSALPENAVITRVILKLRKQGLTGTDPFTSLGNLKVDIRKSFFGTALGLVASDFQATASRTGVGTFKSTPKNNWYFAVIGSTGYPYISLNGTTQFRLLFSTGDNDNGVADYMKFFTGNYSNVLARPTLVITYTVP
jgi:hypothetical protein